MKEETATGLNSSDKPMDVITYHIGELNSILERYSKGQEIHDAHSCNILAHLERITGEKYLCQDGYDSQVNSFLQGKILTIIDAAIHEERANKAIKDLIKGAFRSQYSNVFCSTPIGSAGVHLEE